MNKGKLIFFCGKMGAGKSTKARKISKEMNAVLLSEDEWLESLYPGKIKSLDDYIKYSNLIKPQIKNLVQSVLSAGTHVVMDFPANTVSQRVWFREIFSESDFPHTLIYLNVTDEDCLRRIAKRREEQPHRAKTDTPEMFEAVTRFFTAPRNNEGFNMTEEVADSM